MCLKETSQGDVSFTHTGHMFYRKLSEFIKKPYSLNPLCSLGSISNNQSFNFPGFTVCDQQHDKIITAIGALPFVLLFVNCSMQSCRLSS